MRRLAAVVLLASMATACSFKDPPPTNVKPPRPGVPAQPSDVTGIYRSIHQGLLQLRANGKYNLIVPEGPGATSGTFTLKDGHFHVVSKSCSADEGDYDLVVSGAQEAGSSVLTFSAVADACQDRRHYLTVDPWIYANS